MRKAILITSLLLLLTSNAFAIEDFKQRVFEADFKAVFKAMIEVLTEKSYEIQSSSMDTGYISATSPINETKGAKATRILLGGQEFTIIKLVSTFKTIGEAKTQLTLNLNERRERGFGYNNLKWDKEVKKPTIYKAFFDLIEAKLPTQPAGQAPQESLDALAPSASQTTP